MTLRRSLYSRPVIFSDVITMYRVHLAEGQRDWGTAERLQRMLVTWAREQATVALASPPARLNNIQRNQIRTLSVSVHELGEVLREQQQPACVEAYTESLELDRRIGDQPAQAVVAHNLGTAYKDIRGLRDLDAAERWYQRSLHLVDERDYLGRSRGMYQLGYVHYERFLEAQEAGRPEAELRDHLTHAANAYHQAVGLLPADAVGDLAITHNQLGLIYDAAGDLDTAVRHYGESVRYEEAAGNHYGAGQSRRNVAIAFAERRRFGDALEWARAALRDFQSYGNRAADRIAETQQVIAKIEQAIGGGGA